ncbi:hypothetical protein D3Z42_17080, partial [Lachnospiraceae bacterium]|nr:hypothetical protein [Lachnospiraceae bacterium]
WQQDKGTFQAPLFARCHASLCVWAGVSGYSTPHALISALKYPNGSFIGRQQENANLGRLGSVLLHPRVQRSFTAGRCVPLLEIREVNAI